MRILILNFSATYDKANRLINIQESSNSQGYGYDPHGNRWYSGGSGLPLSSFMPWSIAGYNGQNQLNGNANAQGQVTAQYCDGRGNLTTIGAWSFSYDGENRLVSASNGAQYGYDGLGQRVTKTVGQQTIPTFKTRSAISSPSTATPQRLRVRPATSQWTSWAARAC